MIATRESQIEGLDRRYRPLDQRNNDAPKQQQDNDRRRKGKLVKQAIEQSERGEPARTADGRRWRRVAAQRELGHDVFLGA